MSTRHIWSFWDKSVRLMTQIKPLKHGESHLFCIAKQRYLGKKFVVDGVSVKCFDYVIGLHLDNKMVTQILHENTNLVGVAIKLLRESHKSLPILADCVNSQKYRKANILYGTTLIHRGIEKLGFEIFPLNNNILNSFFTWYLRKIFCAFNPHGESLIQARPEIFIPKTIAISKQRLIDSYGKNK